MKYNCLSRRMFLQGAGKASLAIPFLPSLLPNSANAAGIAQPKYVHINSNLMLPRALAYPLYNNPYPSYPQVANADPSLVPWIQKDADTKFQSLKSIVDLQGKISFVFDEKWNAFATRMNLVTNAHAYMSDNRHNCGLSSACSIGFEGLGVYDIGGPKKKYAFSVDYLVAQKFQSSYGQMPVLRMNIYEDDGGYQTFSFGLVNGVPTNLYMMQTVGELNLKLNGAIASTGQNSTNRVSRLNSVLDDFKKLMNSRRIGAVDRQRLSDAADMWSSVDKRLTTGSGAKCGKFDLSQTATDWGSRHRASLDAIALALSCGITRNVAYGLIQGGDNLNDQGLMHGWEHDPRAGNEVDPTINDPYFSGLVRWRSDMVAHLLKQLDGLTDETGQSLLNSSLVVWAHQFSSNGHGMLGHTLVSAGGANGKLDTGWHVDAGGAPVNRFHLTNMMAMGLTLADIEQSGDPGFGEVATIMNTGDGSNSVITREQDDKQNDSTKRSYDTSKLAYFQQTSERRKPFAYLKA